MSEIPAAKEQRRAAARAAPGRLGASSFGAASESTAAPPHRHELLLARRRSDADTSPSSHRSRVKSFAMARALHRTAPSQPFYRFVRPLSLTASSPYAGSNARVFTGTFTKADHAVSRTLTLVRFQPKASASSLRPCSACLSVNNRPFNGIPFTTVNMTPLGKPGTNLFRVWSRAIPAHVAVSVEQVVKVPEEELLLALDSDDLPYVYKRADTLDLVKGHFDGSSGDAVVEILQVRL